MTSLLPSARPEIGRHAAEQLLHKAGVDISRPAILGRRGYYRDTMGVIGKNDRGLYDDALIVVTPTAYATFNANTDPSRAYPGVAVLEAGLWLFKLGIHNASKDPAAHPHYPALVQADEVIVRRDDTKEFSAGTRHERYGECLGGGRWRGWFGINNHRGGFTSTSSEGCQTVWPPQWEAYFELVKGEMKRYSQLCIPYLLTARPE